VADDAQELSVLNLEGDIAQSMKLACEPTLPGMQHPLLQRVRPIVWKAKGLPNAVACDRRFRAHLRR
jgi:hypothetical protein